MSLNFSLELERERRRIYLEDDGCLVPLGIQPVEYLLTMAEAKKPLRVRRGITGSSREISLKDARWARVGQVMFEEDKAFLLDLAIARLNNFGSLLDVDVDEGANIFTGEIAAAQCQALGVPIEGAEALVAGKPISIVYEETLFGDFPVITIMNEL